MLRSEEVALVILLGLAIIPLSAAQQSPYHPQNLTEILNKEAKATDPAGIHAYSRHLIKLLVPDRAGRAYIDSLSDRLAKAEQMAREGKRKLITEADIATGFNDLMRQIAAPTSLKTDDSMVRKFRVSPLALSPVPALISVYHNGNHCNPGESVFLLWLLLVNNASLDLPPEVTELKPEDLPRVVAIRHQAIEPNAKRLLTVYSSQHHRIDTIKLFDGIARTFDF